MRMWLVNPKILCKNHLMGEHYEIHKLVGNIRVGRSVQGYVTRNLVELHNMRTRHDELALEMVSRGYNHSSPLLDHKSSYGGTVDVAKSQEDLLSRCTNCAERYQKLNDSNQIRTPPILLSLRTVRGVSFQVQENVHGQNS